MLIAPASGAIVTACHEEQQENFSWHASLDPENQAIAYDWILALDSTLSNIVLTLNTDSDTILVLSGQTMISLFQGTSDTVVSYYWAVSASDGEMMTQSNVHAITFVSEIAKTYTLPTTFPAGFTPPHDKLTGATLTGWGGNQGCLIHHPIVFIHGNGGTANDWNAIGNKLLQEGYSPKELWALSYIDFAGGDSASSNMANIAEINDFVSTVMDYTGVQKIDIIAYSLGVTVVRAWVKEYDAYDKVAHLIAIAGANHGVNFCSGPNATMSLCLEIGHPNSEFLTSLNTPDETPRDDIVTYMTIYDGTGADLFYPAFAVFNDGSTGNLLESPKLDGALNVQLAGKDHLQLKDSEESFTAMLDFLRQ
ncbi:MAG: alpha/beta fold hydrolase [bacterium]